MLNTVLYCIGVLMLYGVHFNVSTGHTIRFVNINNIYFGLKSHVQHKQSKDSDIHTHNDTVINEAYEYRFSHDLFSLHFLLLCSFALIRLISSSSLYTCVDRQFGEKLSMSSAI